MNIVVLVKQVPDTWGDRVIESSTGRLQRNIGDAVIDEIGERAVEVALRYKDNVTAQVTVMTMGPASATDVLRKGLAMGADEAIQVLDDTLVGADLVQTSAALAAAIHGRGFDLVIAGSESTDGRGGVIAAMLAERLGIPAVTALDQVTLESTQVTGHRASESGITSIRAALPAVISVTESSAEPRFPGFKGTMRAKKKRIEVLSAALLGLAASPASLVVTVTQRPAREAGVTIVDDGTAARQLTDFLAAKHLI